VTAPSLAELGTDFYVPAYEIRVGGTPLDRQAVRDIVSVSYTDSLEDVDSFELEINNWDEEARTTRYSEGDLFEPGQRVQVSLGYLDAGVVPMLTGEITSLQPRFPADAPPTLAVRGLSILHRLRTEACSQAYERKTDSEIAQEIAGRIGVEIELSSTAQAAEARNEYVLQAQQQDIVFLLQRARRIGYELTAQERGDGTPYLHFAPPAAGIPTPFRLEWGRSLLSFDPTLTTATQVGQVTVRAWHPTEKRLIQQTVTRDELGGGQVFLQAFNQRHEVIADHPVTSDAEARTLALETLRDNALRMVTASASTVGLPRLRAGARVEIGGLGPRYLDGTWYVTGSTHRLGDAGYVTSFDARREVGG
jgi:phage protein D